MLAYKAVIPTRAVLYKVVVFTPTQLDQRIQTARAVDGEQRG